MNPKPYYKLTDEQLDKVGNAMVFLSRGIPDISKTKLLKLMYMLDEISIIRSGIPFFNLQYKVWKLGPVTEEIFIELSDELTWLDKYVKVDNRDGNTYIYAKSDFCDDEFSDNDIELLEYFVRKFKNESAKSLIGYTHRPNSPWRKAAESNGVLDLLENGIINNTEIVVDMSTLVSHDERKKSIFEQYIEEK